MGRGSRGRRSACGAAPYRTRGLALKVAIDANAYRRFAMGDSDAVDVVRRADLLAMVVPVLAELRFGFLNGTKGKQNEARLVSFLDSPRVRIVDCSEQTTHFYAQLKLQLKRQGTPIPINDVWIAALAIQHDLTLFTFDADFDRIPQLAKLRSIS